MVPYNKWYLKIEISVRTLVPPPKKVGFFGTPPPKIISDFCEFLLVVFGTPPQIFWYPPPKVRSFFPESQQGACVFYYFRMEISILGYHLV